MTVKTYQKTGRKTHEKGKEGRRKLDHPKLIPMAAAASHTPDLDLLNLFFFVFWSDLGATPKRNDTAPSCLEHQGKIQITRNEAVLHPSACTRFVQL